MSAIELSTVVDRLRSGGCQITPGLMGEWILQYPTATGLQTDKVSSAFLLDFGESIMSIESEQGVAQLLEHFFLQTPLIIHRVIRDFEQAAFHTLCEQIRTPSASDRELDMLWTKVIASQVINAGIRGYKEYGRGYVMVDYTQDTQALGRRSHRRPYQLHYIPLDFLRAEKMPSDVLVLIEGYRPMIEVLFIIAAHKHTIGPNRFQWCGSLAPMIG